MSEEFTYRPLVRQGAQAGLLAHQGVGRPSTRHAQSPCRGLVTPCSRYYYKNRVTRGTDDSRHLICESAAFGRRFPIG